MRTLHTRCRRQQMKADAIARQIVQQHGFVFVDVHTPTKVAMGDLNLFPSTSPGRLTCISTAAGGTPITRGGSTSYMSMC